MTTEVLINGAPTDGRIPVTDSSVLRGDGCFEVMRSYRGRVFALGEHLDRLEASARALGIELPLRADLESWIAKTAMELGDGAVRVVVTRGSSIPGLDEPSNVIVFGHFVDVVSESGTLLPVAAPWHAAGVPWELSGAKVTSYAPNMAATRKARAEGFDDALLVTTDGTILEGPTFSVGWIVGDALETPALDLGILDSITRRAVLGVARDMGIEVIEATWTLDRLHLPSEVCAWSTIREVQPITRVADREFEPGPVTKRLAEGLRALVG